MTRLVSSLAVAFLLAATPVMAQTAPAAPAAAPAATPVAPAQAPSTLPGGANSLSETHGDWTVSCTMGQTAKDCVLSQGLADSQTGQRVLAVQLSMATASKADGMLLAPFGLRLSDGIKLNIDGVDLGATHPFFTCIQTGCLVPLSFDTAALTALKAGTKLAVTGASADNGQPVVLSLSLAGFTAATARTVELSK